MTFAYRRVAPLVALSVVIPTTLVLAARGEEDVVVAPIAEALRSVDPDVRTFNDHLTTLASPFFEGRVPGSRGMELAIEYVEHYFERYGLEPAFPGEVGSVMTYQQPFELGGTKTIVAQSLSTGAGMEFEPDVDYSVTGMGASGEVSGRPVFVGYSIEDGPDGYSSFAEDDDFTGRVAVMLRFEPMDEDGKSLWSEPAPWSRRAGFNGKIRAAVDRNAEAIIVINTPGADDPRTSELMGLRGSRQTVDVPVLMMSSEAAAEFIADKTDPMGRSLMELRHLADEGGGVIDLDGEIRINVEIERKPTITANVGGLLPGRGRLADELIVIGAHLDHLGMGYFGSRSGPGELHPGADDNASGSAGLLLLAEKICASYNELPEDADARSILFLAFSAEESGLNGSRHYLTDPIVPLEDHALMINFDMIGRILNGRLSVSGANTAEGMSEWLQPILDDSSLTVIQPKRIMGASDHSTFMRKQIPVLFAIIADFHDEYHTPKDVSWKINRVGAVKTVRLFHDIGMEAATRPESFLWANRSSAEKPATPAADGPRRSQMKVRFGIAPGSYDEGDDGVLVGNVIEGTSAAEAGIQEDDILVSWNGEPIADVGAWMGMLLKHEPGDVVKVGIIRDGEEIAIPVTLKGRDTDQ